MTATATFTDPKTWAFQEGVESAELNSNLRDNINSMGPHLIVRKPSDESLTSNTTLQDDNHLILPVAANEVWQVSYGIIYAGATGTGDIKVAFTFPASGDIQFSGLGPDNGGSVRYRRWSGTTSPTANFDFLGFGASIYAYVGIQGVFTNSSTAGSLTLQWAQNAISATATIVRANSTLWAVKLA
jgi:hypothetical protein